MKKNIQKYAKHTPSQLEHKEHPDFKLLIS